ncbi:hypothetical protein [Epibacterium ulvae]|uniref:hypothetical protein n=1 Tax=Epibacterium ulvae TaxID=1156985 RepID=UPI0024916077|nr:hypothetical protein [Epibacterium ulvae]
MRDFAEPICLPPEGRQSDPLEDLYAALAAKQEAKERAADEEAARLHGEIGHNGGPEIKEPKEPFGLKSRWLHFVKELDLRRLARIEYRLSLVERRAKELREERARIRGTAIKRMRRASGKMN